MSDTLYTKLTDRRLTIGKRLDLVEEYWNKDSKQMLFDWLSGLVVNRKKSGLDTDELIRRVWHQLIIGLQEIPIDQLSIRISFIKAMIETLNSDNVTRDHPAIQCCLHLGTNTKELDHKYDQLVELLKLVTNKFSENEELLRVLLEKYLATVRIYGNLNRVFMDVCKQLLVSLLNVRTVNVSVRDLVDEILQRIVFHRTWTNSYREYLESVRNKKMTNCTVQTLFSNVEQLILAKNVGIIEFLPRLFRHCVNVMDQNDVANAFELVVLINQWLEQIQNDALYLNGIHNLLAVLDEKHLIDHLLVEPFEERVTTWLRDILLKNYVDTSSDNYAHLCVVCLRLHPNLVESNLPALTKILKQSDKHLSIFFTSYVELYAQMRALSKLTKRFTTLLNPSMFLPKDVLDLYRTSISRCSHLLVDEIWLSLLENTSEHIVIIQLLSTLVQGYRLFDLNIARNHLLENANPKYDKTLEKLSKMINNQMLTSIHHTMRQCILECYLSLGWFSICLLSFVDQVPRLEDPLNHNGYLMSKSQWSLIESDENLQKILFSLACQRVYRTFVNDENDIDAAIINELLDRTSFSSPKVFEQLEPFFEFLPKNKQWKLLEILINRNDGDRSWFLSNEDRLEFLVQVCVDHIIRTNQQEEVQEKKRKKFDFDGDENSLFSFLSSKCSVSVDEKIIELFSNVYFDAIKSMKILVSIGWLALNCQENNLESLEILLGLMRSKKSLPENFVENVFFVTLRSNNLKMMDETYSIMSKRTDYQNVLKTCVERVLLEMKTNDDAKNIQLLEKYHPLFRHSRVLFPTDDLSSILDRLVNSSCHSSISYSNVDSRYLLAMIILNSLNQIQKYSKFLNQTWTSILREMNKDQEIKCVVLAYARRWSELIQRDIQIQDLDGLIQSVDDQYQVLSDILQKIDFELFQVWIEQKLQPIKVPVDQQDDALENYRLTFQCFTALAHCSLNKQLQESLMVTINSVLGLCGSLIVRLPTSHQDYSTFVSIILNFAIDILNTKRSQLRSQMAVSLLQCCLHLQSTVLIDCHSKICKILSLLVKHHSKTLCKNVSIVETVLKLLFQSVVAKTDKTEEKLIEAARDTTKFVAHLIQQCKEDFRSTIVYVIIDFVHILSRSMAISSDLKKNLHAVIFELLQITGERLEHYSGQIPIQEREMLKLLQQQYKQYHMFKGIV